MKLAEYPPQEHAGEPGYKGSAGEEAETEGRGEEKTGEAGRKGTPCSRQGTD